MASKVHLPPTPLPSLSEPHDSHVDRHARYDVLLVRLRPAILITMFGVIVLLLLALYASGMSLGERLVYYSDMQAVQMFGYILVLAGLALAYVRISFLQDR